jgi:hypothetical protein
VFTAPRRGWFDQLAGDPLDQAYVAGEPGVERLVVPRRYQAGVGLFHEIEVVGPRAGREGIAGRRRID